MNPQLTKATTIPLLPVLQHNVVQRKDSPEGQSQLLENERMFNGRMFAVAGVWQWGDPLGNSLAGSERDVLG